MIEDQSVTGSYSPDGTEQILEQLTVPAGETWYLEGGSARADGAGSTTSHYVGVGVAVSELYSDLFDVSNMDRLPKAQNEAIDTGSNTNSATANLLIDEYGVSGEEVRVMAGADSDASTVYYALHVRRIL